MVVDELKLSHEKKTKPIKKAVKQLLELNKSNSRLLADGLILLQDDSKMPIFFLLNENN